ncbi:YHYH protein [Roseibium denhamense]|uniref:YHYH protein n=1 Tax=Roseibium denhamense TaxID=76305 RepID=A0ABY1NV51_9HYPH|nr:YHYH protein [Roseibium denhamense]MTI05390.1 YHYH protein [Roseibium denhamense]SMP17677.1 YHYH protein [Roseibium denhamense]
MRTAAALICLIAASPAGAHDSVVPLNGEEPHDHAHASDGIWDLLLPDAEAYADITVDGNSRRIRANGYPDKAPGTFPNRNNPHSISKKNYNLKVPLNPKNNGRATNAQGAVFGIAINGVVMDPGTAEYWNNDRRSGWNYEALGGACQLGLDKYNAHVQPDGTYHYHGIPTGVLAAQGGSSAPALLGFAADGFPIYGPYGYSNPQAPSRVAKLSSSYRVKSGTRPDGPGGRYDGKFTQDWAYVAGAGDLDACNGRFAVTPEYPQGTYHYVLTESFPFIPRCWMGTPDSSFSRLKRGGGGQRRGDLKNGPETPDQAPAIDFAAFSDNSAATITLVQHHGGRPPRFLPGGRPPPPGAGRGPGQGPRNGLGPQGGNRPGGRGPCSGS